VNEAVRVLPEPTMEFRYGQALSDPRDGLSAFGPFDHDLPSHPRRISYAIIGTPAGVTAFEAFSERLAGPIIPGDDDDRRLWRPFPGFDAAFACDWPATPVRHSFIAETDLDIRSRHADLSQRVAGVADRYLEAVRRMHAGDDRIDVVICVVPEFVYESCRPQSRVTDPIGRSPRAYERRQREAGQLDFLEPEVDPDVYRYAPDFHSQLKARVMQYGIPIQIVRESTLRLGPRMSLRERGLTPLADRAWNLGLALYYKAGGKPWRLMTAREGVCYLGLAYKKRDPKDHGRTAVAAAQMFLDSGDGIVFLGETGPWFSPERKQCHLSSDAAARLLAGALTTYQDQGGGVLNEIFLHCRSDIDLDAFEGFQSACPPGVKLVGVRVRHGRTGTRLYRDGRWPVLRGTTWFTSSKQCLLWGTGYKPRLETYDGWDVPVPLQVDIQHGDADIATVASDILGLTKLNYNACKIGDATPVTITFSNDVGEILVSNPGVTSYRPQFRFYI
jgi:hypothetical protein